MPLPSWINAAQPAQYAAEGARIALARRESDQREAEREEASSRADQELRLRQQQLEAESTRAAQKYMAQRGYQQAIQSGADPLQAILRFGPAMGEGTDVAAAVRANEARQPKPTIAPKIMMQPGPGGVQIPVLVQGNKASVVPLSAYSRKPAVEPEQWKPVIQKINGRDVPGQQSTRSGMFKPFPASDVNEPEQWQETTRKISGRDIPGQVSSKTGLFRPYPTAEQSGYISPQQRAQIATLKQRKKEIETRLADDHVFLPWVRQQNGGKSLPAEKVKDIRKGQEDLVDQLDKQIDALEGGGGAAADAGPKQLNHALAAKFLSDAGGDKEKARQAAKEAGYDF